jgi:hypothetical protein
MPEKGCSNASLGRQEMQTPTNPRIEKQVYQLNTHEAGTHRGAEPERPGVVIEIDSLARARSLRADRPLKCVASGHLADGCSCTRTVPAAVAEASWARTQARGARSLEGFFHFNWQAERWLAFGLAGGEVRGVICPAHRAEREAVALRSA